MSKKTKLAAVNPKPNAPNEGFRQFSSRIGGGAFPSDPGHSVTAVATHFHPGSGFLFPFLSLDSWSSRQPAPRHYEQLIPPADAGSYQGPIAEAAVHQ